MRPPVVLLALSFAAAATACGQVLDLGTPREAWPQDAPDADVPPTEPAVGFVTGIARPIDVTRAGANDANAIAAARSLTCTGVLVGARTVLTSSRCLGDPASMRFALNAPGDAVAHADTTAVYAVESVHHDPKTEPTLLHLAVAADQPEPASIARPLTPITASSGAASPFGEHASVTLGQAVRAETWRIEDGGVTRSERSGAIAMVGDDVQVAASARFTAAATDQGGPALVETNAQRFVIGALYGSDGATLTYRASFGATEGPWMESVLWLYDEAVGSGARPPAPPGAYAWIRVDFAAGTGPSAFFVTGTEDLGGGATRALGACVTWHGGRQIIGKYFFENGGCAFPGDAHDEAWTGIFKVLTVHGSATWNAAPGGVPVAGSFAPGYDGTTPITLCRAQYVSGLQPGSVRDGACHVTWGGAEQVVSDFETLVLAR